MVCNAWLILMAFQLVLVNNFCLTDDDVGFQMGIHMLFTWALS